LSRATENDSAPGNVSVSWQCAEQRVSDPASLQVTADRSGRRHGLLPRSPARQSSKCARNVTVPRSLLPTCLARDSPVPGKPAPVPASWHPPGTPASKVAPLPGRCCRCCAAGCRYCHSDRHADAGFVPGSWHRSTARVPTSLARDTVRSEPAEQRRPARTEVTGGGEQHPEHRRPGRSGSRSAGRATWRRGARRGEHSIRDRCRCGGSSGWQAGSVPPRTSPATPLGLLSTTAVVCWVQVGTACHRRGEAGSARRHARCGPRRPLRG